MFPEWNHAQGFPSGADAAGGLGREVEHQAADKGRLKGDAQDQCQIRTGGGGGGNSVAGAEVIDQVEHTERLREGDRTGGVAVEVLVDEGVDDTEMAKASGVWEFQGERLDLARDGIGEKACGRPIKRAGAAHRRLVSGYQVSARVGNGGSSSGQIAGGSDELNRVRTTARASRRQASTGWSGRRWLFGWRSRRRGGRRRGS